MAQTITVKIKLLPTKEQSILFEQSSYEYISTVNSLVSEMVEMNAITKQTCPACFERNKPQDRKYKCSCGFEKHRDIVGAMNIRYATVIDGNSQSA